MIPKFTTPCYVRIDDKAKQKEVCEKLGQMEYRVFRAINNPSGYTIFTDLFFADGSYTNEPCYAIWKNHMVVKVLRNTHIDCGENEALFIDLAGMRSDTDKRQLFINESLEVMFRCKDRKFASFYVEWEDGLTNIRSYFRRATATDIINYHKQKGE